MRGKAKIRIASLVIGSEIVDGYVKDLNFPYLVSIISELSLEKISLHIVVPDSEEEILNALKFCEENSDVTVVSGGLGATLDDKTRECASKFFKRKMIKDKETEEKIRSIFSSRGIPLNELVLKQALFPENSKILENPMGTASGFFIKSKSNFFFLPGVPREFQKMVQIHVIPYLKQFAPSHIASKVLKLFGISETNLQERIQTLINSFPDINFSFLPNFPEVYLKISGKPYLLSEVEKGILNSVGEFVYGEGEDTISSVVISYLSGRGETVSCSESPKLTGGLLSEMLSTAEAKQPQSVFLGSLIISKSTDEMIEICSSLFKSDWILAISKEGEVIEWVISKKGLKLKKGSLPHTERTKIFVCYLILDNLRKELRN